MDYFSKKVSLINSFHKDYFVKEENRVDWDKVEKTIGKVFLWGLAFFYLTLKSCDSGGCNDSLNKTTIMSGYEMSAPYVALHSTTSKLYDANLEYILLKENN